MTDKEEKPGIILPNVPPKDPLIIPSPPAKEVGPIRKVDTFEAESPSGMMVIRRSYEVGVDLATEVPDTTKYLITGARFKVMVQIAPGMPEQERVLPLPPFEVKADSIKEAFENYEDAVKEQTDLAIKQMEEAEKMAKKEAEKIQLSSAADLAALDGMQHGFKGKGRTTRRRKGMGPRPKGH